MRVLVWATTFGAIVGSAHAGGAAASPFKPSLLAEQFPDRTFELVALSSGAARRDADRVDESWISSAFLSPSDYETLSSMAGFHDGAAVASLFAPGAGLNASPGGLGDRALADQALRPGIFVDEALAVPVDLDWDEVDGLPSPAVLDMAVVVERRYLVGDEDASDEPVARVACKSNRSDFGADLES